MFGRFVFLRPLDCLRNAEHLGEPHIFGPGSRLKVNDDFFNALTSHVHQRSGWNVLMWESMHSVEWGELEHSQGAADNIPAVLKQLLAKSSRVRSNAYTELATSLCPEGTYYSAAVAVIPFLFEILDHDRIPDRNETIDLLLGIATGVQVDELLTGTTIDQRNQECRNTLEKSVEEKRPTWNSVYSTLVLDCYNAVQRGVPKFIQLTRSADERIARHAAYALAWFPAAQRKSLPRLREILKNPKSDNQLANFILATGLLEHHADSKRTTKKQVRNVMDRHDELVRFAAAIYLAWHDPSPEVFDVLRTLSGNYGFECIYDQTPFCGGDLRIYAEYLLNRG